MATGFLYWELSRSLDREDDQLLADRVRIVRSVLRDRPGDLEALSREVMETAQARLNFQSYVRMIGRDGGQLAETPGMGEILPVDTFPAPVAEPGVGADIRTGEGRTYRGMTVRLVGWPTGSSPEVVQVAMDRSHEDELLADYRRNLVLVLAVALAVCAAVGYSIARRGIRPIDEITETTRRIRPTNLGERVAADRLPAELLALAETFNQMLDRLEQSFARLSRFSADIAHELRTPINNLRGEVEVALGKPRTAEEYRDVLGSCLEECGRLARMIDSLLFLARAENPQTQVVRERLDVATELGTVCEFYEAAATEAGVSLAVAVDGHVMVDMNRPLFQRAMGNLVANAIAHTPPGGAVTLTATGDETKAEVEVADTGCGIPASHLPHVFDRFYRADPSRSTALGGVGLGLAIVRSIAELHGGAVEINSQVGQGTRVVVTLPRTNGPASSCPPKMTNP